MDAVHDQYLGEPLCHDCMQSTMTHPAGVQIWSPEAVSCHQCREHRIECYHYLPALDRLV